MSEFAIERDASGRYVSQPLPPPLRPARGQVLLRPDMIGICGSDLLAHSERRNCGCGFGHEWTGEIVALGPGVDGFRVGERATSGAFIGCAGLDARNDGLELGYWIGEPYWGHGYATEAAHALVDLAFRATAIDVLHVSCRVINAASRRVIHKCGFQYAAQGMMDSLVAGKVPVERYRLDRRTWVSLRSWSQS